MTMGSHQSAWPPGDPEASVCWACGLFVQHNTGHDCEAFDD